MCTAHTNRTQEEAGCAALEKNYNLCEQIKGVSRKRSFCDMCLHVAPRRTALHQFDAHLICKLTYLHQLGRLPGDLAPSSMHGLEKVARRALRVWLPGPGAAAAADLEAAAEPCSRKMWE
eukprot:535795-Pelagomonas_calceolata.AAC.1